MFSLFSGLFHQHRMILVEDDEEKKLPNTSCNNCKLPISSNHQFYKCSSRRCSFKLHKACKEIPSEIEHPRHPNHPLTLGKLSQSSRVKCFCCKDMLTDMQIYRCKECPSFKIDILCACPPGFKIEHGSHPQHPLIPFNEDALFLCQACGTRHQGRPLLCNLCWFWIDRSCAQLPFTLEANDHHQHPLDLVYSLPGRFGSMSDHRLPCEICGHPIDSTFWVYYCGQCKYFAHIRCATSATEPFMSIFNPARSRPVDFHHKSAIRLPVESEFVNLVPYLLESSKRLYQSFHPGLKEPLDRFPGDDRGHNFIRHRKMPEKDTNDGSSIRKRNEESNSSLCNACIQPISPPFYSCTDTKCNFLVHTKCFEVPFNVHSGDKRLSFGGLNLKTFFSVFHCDACHRPCNGYYFQRVEGNRVLDVKCALSPEFIIHESHPKHRLILDKRRYAPCPCCLLAGEDQGEYIYRCETCSFNLHQKCALYPSTVRHRYDKHPLKLTYKPISGGFLDECYCEICELELNQHGWFYHCGECEQSFHVICIPALDHLSNIKFGGTLTLNFHAHPLTLDRIILERSCQCCNEIIKDGMAFQCKECTRYQIHFQCAKSSSLAQGQDIQECIFASWDTGNPYSDGGELPTFVYEDKEPDSNYKMDDSIWDE